MSKKVFRPFNTWGIVLIGFVVVSVLTYSVDAMGVTIEVDEEAGTCEVVQDEVVVVTPPPPPPPTPAEVTDLGSFYEPTWGMRQQRIPAGQVVSFSFTADAIGKHGVIEFSNNMPHLAASGYMFKAWFSEEPGGEHLYNNSYCRMMSPDPNPKEMRWTQDSGNTRWKCDLGYEIRTLYFNMAVGCYEGTNNGRCTVGTPYNRDYYVKVYPR